MCQIFILIGEQTKHFLNAGIQGRAQQQDKKLQHGLALIWTFLQIDFLNIESTSFAIGF
jgi:hypothetical protein